MVPLDADRQRLDRGLFPRFSGAEHQRRRQAVEELLAASDLQALIVYGSGGFPGPVHYLSEFTPRQPTWLIFSPGDPSTLLLHFVNHLPATEALSTVDDVRCYWPDAAAAVADEVRRRVPGSSRVGVVGSARGIPHGQFMDLQAQLAGVELVDVTRELQQIRWLRSDEELDRFRASGELIDRACDHLAEQLRPGMTELEAKAVLHESFVPAGGVEGIIFLAGVDMAAPDRRSPWQFPTRRRLEAGHALITEITISYYGYGAQIHRPFAVAEPPSQLYRDLFDAASACFEQVKAVVRDGASAVEVSEAARVVESRDFVLFDSLVHGEGGKNPEIGGAGSPHAPESWTFREGQVMIIQPNTATRDGRAGLQAGCAVRVGAEGAEPLHGYPLQFPVCG